LGGAGNLTDFKNAYQHGNVNGIAAGSFLYIKETNKGVLINYPSWQDVTKIVKPNTLVQSSSISRHEKYQ
jgi:imidazole glycerol phosphate synthase subunit HisF